MDLRIDDWFLCYDETGDEQRAALRSDGDGEGNGLMVVGLEEVALMAIMKVAMDGEPLSATIVIEREMV